MKINLANIVLSMILGLVGFLLPVVASAITLDEAKSSGLVGEKLDGYLGTVSNNPSKEVVALVEDINKRRKASYQEIAKKNGTELKAVEMLAAEKAIAKTTQGQYIQLPNGNWGKK